MNIDLPVQLFTAHPVDCIWGHKATSAELGGLQKMVLNKLPMHIKYVQFKILYIFKEDKI